MIPRHGRVKAASDVSSRSPPPFEISRRLGGRFVFHKRGTAEDTCGRRRAAVTAVASTLPARSSLRELDSLATRTARTRTTAQHTAGRKESGAAKSTCVSASVLNEVPLFWRCRGILRSIEDGVSNQAMEGGGRTWNTSFLTFTSHN
ncbi:hypothetical protein MTO96_018107 [Rhipicephalus appendiculatus]